MITFKKECYAVYVDTDERSSALLGYFTSPVDAERAGTGKGWWGGNGRVSPATVTITIYENLDEYEQGLEDKLRKAALSKLTDQEKQILGL
jgi:hypothetical protein